MITFDHVCFSYGDTTILRDVSCTFPSKGSFWFSGPSGCGKTTLLRLLAGLEIPCGGTIHRHTDLTISMVFQENRLLPWLTVFENVSLVCADPIRVCEVLQTVSLWEERGKKPDTLSGGMQRRVALARAMAYDGDILLLDEPFTGLDDELCRSIAESLYRQFEHKLILLVTHSDTEPTLFDATPISLSSPIHGPLL